jgi:hypothetical protein
MVPTTSLIFASKISDPVISANEETLTISMMRQIVYGTSHNYVLSTLSIYLGYVIGTSV